MINEKSARLYCREDISLIENYEQAINDKTQTWQCHHKDEVKILPSGIKVVRSSEELKENGRYYHCPANELIFLTRSEHRKLHNKDNKFSFGKKNWLGKHHTEETKKRMSNSQKGKKLGKFKTEFGRKYFEHYGLYPKDNKTQYTIENHWYLNHNHTCRWEKEA